MGLTISQLMGPTWAEAKATAEHKRTAITFIVAKGRLTDWAASGEGFFYRGRANHVRDKEGRDLRWIEGYGDDFDKVRV